MLTSLGGLPLHPLVVHAVVVLLPLATLGALAVAARPRWSRAYGPLVAAGAVAAAVAAVVAVEAGEALQATLAGQGDPLEGIQRHSSYGETVRALALAFAVAAVAAVVLDRRRDGAGGAGRARLVAAVVAWLAAGLGLLASVWAYLAGESGAQSVWGYVFGS